MTTSSREPHEASAEAESLIADAQTALDESFGPLTWEESAPESSREVEEGCRLSAPTRRCDTYLGKESADHERIAAALTTALDAHGLPAAPTPTGGTGGWLTTSSSADGITLSFRSKGYAELSVTVVVAEECAEIGWNTAAPGDGFRDGPARSRRAAPMLQQAAAATGSAG